MTDRELAVEQLHASYKEKGFITNDEIYAVCDKYDLSFFDTDYVANKIIDLGILVTEKITSSKNVSASIQTFTSINETTDYSQTDYNVIYEYFLNRYPEMKPFVEFVKSIPPIQHGEINKYIEQINSGNAYAKELAFQKYLRLALKCAYNYRERTTLPLEDIVQEACLSILKAIDSYDPYTHSAFASYCSTWMMQRVDRYIADHESFIRIPVYALEPIYKLRDRFDECYPLADVDKLAIIRENLELPYDDAYKLLEDYNCQLNIYLDDVFESYDDIFIEDDTDVITSVENKYLPEALNKALYTLTDRESTILKYRFGLIDGKAHTLEESGQKLGLTRERIRQIEAKALRKLQHSNRSKNLKIFLE